MQDPAVVVVGCLLSTYVDSAKYDRIMRVVDIMLEET